MAPIQSRTTSLSFFVLSFFAAIASALASTDRIQRGFSTNPRPPPSSQFQPVLTDPTSTFAFGFLPIQKTRQLDLAIVHLPSSFPLWRATPGQLATWSTSTSLAFNGSSLVLSSPDNGVFWSTPSPGSDSGSITGDNLIMLNSSNLRITATKAGHDSVTLWQSFDYPSDTIVQNQNLTSEHPLLSSNRKFSMGLGPNYLALYMELNLGRDRPMYWKRTPLQAKNEIVEGGGPIYARVDPTGYLGVYQKEGAPVDVIPFDTFNDGAERNLRRLTLEPDGNVRAYYWNGSSGWVRDFAAVAETCELPSPCGPYGTCHVEGQTCRGCLDNRTDACVEADPGDLCGSGGGGGFRVLRRTGVDLANKELTGNRKVGSLEECEGSCEQNCSCWGAFYNNVTGFCYPVSYPIQTVLAVGDEKKLGFFKVRNGDDARVVRNEARRRAGIVLVIAGALVLAIGCGFAAYRTWSVRRWGRNREDDDVVMPYKDLNSSSFRSIEMSSSFRK